MKIKRILLLEDDKDLNNGIRMALEQEGIQFLSCFQIQEARQILQSEGVDLILLDINLPDGDGLDFLREIKRESEIPVILLTAKDMETDVVAGLLAGADDYVTKPFSLAILRARVEVQLRKVTETEEERTRMVYDCAQYHMDFEQQIFQREHHPVELSRTEQKILYYLVKHCGNVIPREQLRVYVWSDGATYMDENSLSVAVNRLRSKLEDKTHLRTVYGIGYCWSETGESL